MRRHLSFVRVAAFLLAACKPKRGLAFLATLAAGCAISPGPEVPVAQMCNVPRTYLGLEAHDDPARTVATMGTQNFSRSLLDAYFRPPPVQLITAEEPVSPSMLFLSGGSQHGAFGGGFVHEWAKERPSGLPRFKVVTGISTGAIIATHAFLDRTETIVKNERIFAEKELLNRYVGKAGMKSIGGGLTTVRKGSVGDLYPMRERFLTELTDEVVRAVAREADQGRKLYVGAVDIDLGKAAIFDMTEYAQKYAARPATDIGLLAHMRRCYANVILASSSVPVAAPPTFIDNRMYIDGGARFGLITDEIGKTADELGKWFDAGRLLSLGNARPNIYVLINGTLEMKLRCGKAKKSNSDDPCPPGSPVASTAGQHEDWDILSLVERSVGILINQIYRFSNDRIWLAATQKGFVPHMQRMLPDIDKKERALPEFPGAGPPRTCDAWAKEDERIEHPVEFHPRYMHCLVEYGAERAEKSKWACFDPLPAFVGKDARMAWDNRCRGVPQSFTDSPLLRIR